MPASNFLGIDLADIVGSVSDTLTDATNGLTGAGLGNVADVTNGLTGDGLGSIADTVGSVSGPSGLLGGLLGGDSIWG